MWSRDQWSSDQPPRLFVTAPPLYDFVMPRPVPKRVISTGFRFSQKKLYNQNVKVSCREFGIKIPNRLVGGSRAVLLHFGNNNNSLKRQAISR